MAQSLRFPLASDELSNPNMLDEVTGFKLLWDSVTQAVEPALRIEAVEQAQFGSEPKEKTKSKVISASDFLSSRPCRSCQLWDDVKLDLCDAASNHSQRFGRSVGKVDNASADVRTAVIDADRHGLPTGDVGYAQPGAEWQRGMGGG